MFSVNVEYLHGDKCVKYVTKYLMKGCEMAFVDTKEEGVVDYDEYQQLRMARYISAPEAFLSIHGHPLVKLSHEV